VGPSARRADDAPAWRLECNLDSHPKSIQFRTRIVEVGLSNGWERFARTSIHIGALPIAPRDL